MNIEHKHDFKPCVVGAFSGGLSRALFFDGMVLSETDLLREQAYWRMKRKLTNRALGEGVVWGLTTVWNPKAHTFTVCPGYGLSCCGDDLIVECPETVGEGQLVDPCSEEFRALLHDKFDKCEECAPPDEPVPAALMLEYIECPEDPRSTYEDPCAEVARGCRFGAVRETVRLRLVPPPQECPSPLDRFCRKIRELREELAKANINMPEPEFNPLKAANRFGVATLGADGSMQHGSSTRVELEDGNSAQTETPAASQARIFVDPPDGHIFVTVNVDGADQPGASTMLGWSQLLNPVNNTNYTIIAETAPLFGPGPGLRLQYNVGVTAGANVKINVAVDHIEELELRTDCVGIIGGRWLYDGDALCRAKALALAMIYAVASGRIASADCGTKDISEDEANARKTIAWALCWIGWKALYGIDTHDPKAAKIQNCLHYLFVEWCEGFAYKGPYCCATSHGIYLGGVELSPKGRVLCFDPWLYRRYVLTGPLLTHWAGQFGMPPVDRVALRLASWICCVAKADFGTAPAVLDQASEMLVPMRTGALVIGGAAPQNSRAVEPFEFALGVLSAYFDRGGSVKTPNLDVAHVNGSPMYLVTPLGEMAAAPPPPPPPPPAAEFMNRHLVGTLVDVPPMALEPTNAFIAEFTRTLPITSLQPATDNPNFDATLVALEKANIGSVAALAAIGPENAADKVRAELVGTPEFPDAAAVDKAMGVVYERALGLIRNAGGAIADEARAREPEDPFTRSDLPEVVTKVQLASREFLKKGQGATRAALRNVAARVVAARG